MRVLAAPNAFKGSLTAVEAARAIAGGLRRVDSEIEVVELPIADGGDGTLATIMATANGETITVKVKNPLGDEIDAQFGLLDDGTAIIEMAAASGLRLIKDYQLDPMKTTTYGTGQLIQAALEHGAEKVIIGVGGSATVEGGIGMAQALGFRLTDVNGNEVSPGGDGLEHLRQIDIRGSHPRISKTHFIVASDVNNPLLSETGAARVFGPQKGASPAMVEQLELLLTRYAQVIGRDLGVSVADLPGAGAAGGLGAGLAAFLGAEIESGVDVVLDTLDTDSKLAGVDLVITGEGAIDSQTIYGKAPIGIARRAQQRNIPVIALAGSIAVDAGVVYEHGIDALVPILHRPMSLDEAMTDAAELITHAAERAMRLFRLGLDSAV